MRNRCPKILDSPFRPSCSPHLDRSFSNTRGFPGRPGRDVHVRKHSPLPPPPPHRSPDGPSGRMIVRQWDDDSADSTNGSLSVPIHNTWLELRDLLFLSLPARLGSRRADGTRSRQPSGSAESPSPAKRNPRIPCTCRPDHHRHVPDAFLDVSRTGQVSFSLPLSLFPRFLAITRSPFASRSFVHSSLVAP